MGFGGDKKIEFEVVTSDGHEWLTITFASPTVYESGISLGKAGPLESDADHRATMGRWTSVLAAAAGVKFDGANMSTLDTAFNNLATQTSGPFANEDAGDWWATFTTAQKLEWVDVIWAKAKRVRF